MTDKEVLLNLKRKYTDNEVIQALYKELSNADIENGKLKSTIDELEYKLENSKLENRDTFKEFKHKLYNKIDTSLNKHKVTMKYRETIKEKNSEITRLRRNISDLTTKLLQKG